MPCVKWTTGLVWATALGSRLSGTVHQSLFPACYTLSLGDGQESLNPQLLDPFIQASLRFPGQGLEADSFHFFLFNPHNCGVSIVRLLRWVQVIKWLSQSNDTFKSDTHIGTSVISAVRDSSGIKGLGCVPPVCAV